MTARAFLTGHSRQEKEAARKCGPSLQRKSKKLGTKANIRTLTLYEDPTHGFWHIAKYCPKGKTFPDVGKLVDEFSKTGKPPVVRDVRGRRPGPSAVRKVDSSSRRRSTRNAPKTNQDIYDVPNDDDSETLCSASVLYRRQSAEGEEWGPDESTVGDASPAEAASTVAMADVVREQDVLGECDAAGEANTTEHTVLEETSAMTEAVAAPEADHAAHMEPMGWETEYSMGMEDNTAWMTGDRTGMEATLIWDAENATSMEDPLAWEPEMDMEGWDAYSPETSGQNFKGAFPAVTTMTALGAKFTGMESHKAQSEELSRKWAAFAGREAAALQRRYIACLW